MPTLLEPQDAKTLALRAPELGWTRLNDSLAADFAFVPHWLLVAIMLRLAHTPPAGKCNTMVAANPSDVVVRNMSNEIW
eukprot:445471-Amphidinium_carterae.1